VDFTVNASLRWLSNVSAVYLVQVSLLLIGQQSLGHFFRYRPLLPIGWRIVQILRQRRRKFTNTVPTTFRAVQAASQSLLSINNYSLLGISWNYKNKQLTLLSQTRINREKHTFCIICKIIGSPKQFFKNGSVLYLGLKLTIHVIKRQTHLVR
jgi:hypothetical protein